MINIKTPILLLLAILFFSMGCSNDSDEVNASLAPDSQEENYAEPTKIILLIGDGMGLSQITAGMLANNNSLHLEDFTHIGLIKTASSDNIITDSAAAATAISTGKKTYNGAIGLDADGLPVQTVLEFAGNGKYLTGLVATSSITHATPASFFAHQSSRGSHEAIAMDMLSAPVDFFIAGGQDYFDQRSDNLNLLDSLKNQEFEIYEDITSISSSSNKKVAGFIAEKHPFSMQVGRGNVLAQASKKALDYFSGKENFFLVIEGSQIDWEGHDNDSEGIIAEMLDFNEAIGVALRYAKNDGNTLVIVTSDHETGGYSILGGDSNQIEGGFSTELHTGSLVPVFAYGPGSKEFSGIYENTAIFDKMMKFIENP